MRSHRAPSSVTFRETTCCRHAGAPRARASPPSPRSSRAPGSGNRRLPSSARQAVLDRQRVDDPRPAVGHGRERDGHAGDGAARDQAGGEQIAGAELGLASAATVSPRLRARPIGQRADQPADEDRRGGGERQVGADRERQRADAAELDGGGQRDADHHELPVEVEGEEPLDERRHQRRLRGGVEVGADQVVRRPIEHPDGEADDQRRGHHPDEQADLLRARRGADQEPGLEVLRRRAGVRGGDADHRPHAQRHRLVDVGRPAQADEDQAGPHQRRDGHARDRVRRRADEADDPAGDGDEEEPEDDDQEPRAAACCRSPRRGRTAGTPSPAPGSPSRRARR